MKHTLSEALYALPGGVVVKRRRPIFGTLVLCLVGIVLMIMPFFVVLDESGSLDMLLMVVGAGLALYAGIKVAFSIASNEGVPYYTPTRSLLRYRERYYEREHIAAIRRAIEHDDLKAIDLLPTTNVSAVTFAEYRTSKGDFVACVLGEYSESEIRPVTKPRVITTKA